MRLGVAGQECSGCGLGVARAEAQATVGGARAEAQATVEGGGWGTVVDEVASVAENGQLAVGGADALS